MRCYSGAFVFLTLGMNWRCMAAMPLLPKKTVAGHAATQARFLEEELEPGLDAARSENGHVLFADAANFVHGAFLCRMWCKFRLFIRGASGRQRCSVMGAWNVVTNELIHITTVGTVSSDTKCKLLLSIALLELSGLMTLVVDHVRDQYCAVVMSLAATLKIELRFLPSYSPNLNLI